MKKMTSLLTVMATLALVILASSCSVEEADTVARTVSKNVAGVYRGVDGAPLVQINSGAEVIQLNVLQTGDQLEAIDNNNKIFHGSIGTVSASGEASFTLEGSTTAGNSVTIVGTFSGSDSTITMRGTWIEPGIYSTIHGEAVGQYNSAITVTGSAALSSTNGSSYTASGGTTYTWSLSSSSIGSLSATEGTTVTYTPSASGTQKLTATSDGISGSIEITQTITSSPSEITITGSSTLNSTNAATYSASGGTTYTWSLSSSTLGTLSSTTGDSVSYTASTSGTQRITVTSGSLSDFLDVIQTITE